MAQVVIFAPPGEDVSAGEQALKDGGHDVEVVEATAENLLHMAIGMIGGDSGSEAPPEEESTEEDPLAEPAEETSDEPEEEDPKKMESLGTCMVGDEKVDVKKGKKTRLYVGSMKKEEVGEAAKRTFTINESTISTWDSDIQFVVEGSSRVAPIRLSYYGQTYLEAGPELHSAF